jgi:hypothetical protein
MRGKKLRWRLLFWFGIVAVMFGTSMATAYVNGVFDSELYLLGGFGFIGLGVVSIALGVLVSKQTRAALI